MAQVMNAHIGKIQLSAQVVPEQIDVGERSARCAPGKEPGAVGAAWQKTDDCYGLVGKDNMAWAVRLGKGHRQQMFLQVDMLPAGLEDFALACAGQQQKLQGLASRRGEPCRACKSRRASCCVRYRSRSCRVGNGAMPMHGETGSTPQMTASEQTLLKTLKMRLQVAGASPLAASKPNQISTSLREISCSRCRAKVGRICCRSIRSSTCQLRLRRRI